MRRISFVAVLACFLVVPAIVGAADMGNTDKLIFGDAEWISQNEVMVPVSVVHDEALVGMDIPLKWSEGVTLTNVSFEGTRVDYFDAKIANIDEENNKVLIGLISMVYAPKDALKAAVDTDNAKIAELTFRIDDANLTQFEITPFETRNPGHSLSLVYNRNDGGKLVVDNANPVVEGNTIALAKNPGDAAGITPTAYSLGQNYPNPFNPSTTISYSIKNPGNVKISIYNVLGQNVRTLVDEYQEANAYTVVWDGMDNAGNTVSSGVYFYRVEAGDYSAIRKMVLMK